MYMSVYMYMYVYMYVCIYIYTCMIDLNSERIRMGREKAALAGLETFSSSGRGVLGIGSSGCSLVHFCCM